MHVDDVDLRLFDLLRREPHLARRRRRPLVVFGRRGGVVAPDSHRRHRRTEREEPHADAHHGHRLLLPAIAPHSLCASAAAPAVTTF